MPCAPVWSMPPNIIFNDTMNTVATLIIYQLIFFLLAGASAVILLVYKKAMLEQDAQQCVEIYARIVDGLRTAFPDTDFK